MKIYFCGSIRAGRSDANLYAKIIKQLGVYGKVLTEHVGFLEPWNAPHLSKYSLGQGDLAKDKEIFRTDMEWLHSANIVVAECTVPSIGVGFELGAAYKLGLPTLILYRKNPNIVGLSAMVRGVPSKNWEVFEYNDPKELDERLKDFCLRYMGPKEKTAREAEFQTSA
uniref:Putative 2'-deoxynucleoside 5'-phosphate N-hydrolase 1 n=1 Tax=Syphacia muris TaxID=451379 RepID=A0A0N5AUN8_9BILA